MNAVVLSHNIDTSFITQLERRNDTYKFMRIDSDINDSIKNDSDEDVTSLKDKLTEVFRSALSNDKLDVQVASLKNNEISSMITVSEEGRRMQDMMKMYAMGQPMDMSMFAPEVTLTLNSNNDLVKYIIENSDSENVPLFCEQLYDLALISNQPLSTEAMQKFIARSNKIMMLLAK